jgi:hypothetical protein
MINNTPLAYDFHGIQPIDFPFSMLRPEDIDIYMDVDTYIGNDTCGQNCRNCWFVNNDKVKRKRFDVPEGQLIVKNLREIGYKVYPRYTDTFAYKGEFILGYGASTARVYAEKNSWEPTKTMQKGEAWTSGRPLLSKDAEYLLDLAKEYNYGTISISFHGLLDENLTIENETNYPIKGVFHASNFEKVISIIKDYNRRKEDERFSGFRINIGLTLGKHNFSTEKLQRYIDYFNKLGISTVRFNRFFDHGHKHPHLELSEDEINGIYKTIKTIHEKTPLTFQINMSGDLGTSGVEIMNFPENVNMCKGGRQLFALIPCEKKDYENTEKDRLISKVGELTGCVNIFEPILGSVLREVKDSKTRYYIEWNTDNIDKLLKFRQSDLSNNGCFSRELLELIEKDNY